MNIEKQIIRDIKKYGLIKKNDKIVVALSGGKDSVSTLYILNKLGYSVQGLMIDLNLGEWSKIHNRKMTAFCKTYDIPLKIVDLKKELGQGICFIKSVLAKEKGLTGCSVCGTVKKWILNKWAKKLRADKLATGHNLDDEAQNVLMNFLKGNVMLGTSSAPKTSKEKGFVPRIKPLFFTPEDEVRKFAKKNKFDILYDRCPCAFGTYRVETRAWMKGITNSEKKKIVTNFQKLAPTLRTQQTKTLQKCKTCGEPSTRDICNFCKIMKCI